MGTIGPRRLPAIPSESIPSPVAAAADITTATPTSAVENVAAAAAPVEP